MEQVVTGEVGNGGWQKVRGGWCKKEKGKILY